jgi:hypothetical protein
MRAARRLIGLVARILRGESHRSAGHQQAGFNVVFAGS